VRAAARAVAVAAAAAACGCAYFNGMYYANHYTRLAQSAERAGRTGDARDRWQQAEIHAESLISRHPKSRYVSEAQLVRGRALVHLEVYSDAALALQMALRAAASPSKHMEELGLIGHAYLVLGMLDSASQALDTAVDARERAVRDQALLDRGRLFMLRRRADLAREDLALSRDPRAPFELAQADLVLGDTAAAGALYDSLAGLKTFPEAAWREGLDSLAAAGAGAHASQLANRLAGRPGVSSGAKARLLLDDGGRRLDAADTAGATSEFRRIVDLAPDSLAGQTAAVEVCRLGIASAASDTELPEWRSKLGELMRSGGNAGRDAYDELRLLGRIDSLAEAATAGDAFWFLRAELLRDSLHAGRLAADAFAQMAVKYPASPWTPKALVAAIEGGYAGADTLRQALAQRYAGSPYARAALGGDSAGDTTYARLEDSLRRVLAVAETRRPGPVDRARPGVLGGVGEETAPHRPTPASTPGERARPQPSGPPSPEPPE